MCVVNADIYIKQMVINIGAMKSKITSFHDCCVETTKRMGGAFGHDRFTNTVSRLAACVCRQCTSNFNALTYLPFKHPQQQHSMPTALLHQERKTNGGWTPVGTTNNEHCNLDYCHYDMYLDIHCCYCDSITTFWGSSTFEVLESYDTSRLLSW